MRRLLVPLVASFAAACGSPTPPIEPPKGADPSVVASAATSASSVRPAASAPPTPTASVSAAPAATSAPAAELPKELTVLVIGDSFAQALGLGLKHRERELGMRVLIRGQQATYIPEWAGPNRGVDRMIRADAPDLVLIALGGNELAMTTPEIRRPKVAELVAKVGDIPCIWLSPPLWNIKDNGLLGVIRGASSPCRYFDSDKLVPSVPRGSDKIHPSAEGQRVWADGLLAWMRGELAPPAGKAKLALRPRPDSE
jgi:lysophospholipase L1-like esterase